LPLRQAILDVRAWLDWGEVPAESRSFQGKETLGRVVSVRSGVSGERRRLRCGI